MTTLSSKILAADKEHFAELAVDAVMRLKVQEGRRDGEDGGKVDVDGSGLGFILNYLQVLLFIIGEMGVWDSRCG